MSEAPYYPRAEVEARFRRPKVLQVPSDESDVLRLRLEWDDPVHVEELLEVDLPIDEEKFCRCTARVARVDPIVWKEPTRYEVYLELFELEADEREAIEDLLEPVLPGSTPAAGSSSYVLQGPFHEGTSFRRPRREEAAKV